MMFVSCQPEQIDDIIDPEIEAMKNMGSITFDFPIPDRRVPVKDVHRVDLSLAVDAFSLYSGYFLVSANVSDMVRSYTFILEEGEYYFQAGITCSSQGDTCLWDGFPGGQWGTKWISDKIEIVKGEKLVKILSFNR